MSSVDAESLIRERGRKNPFRLHEVSIKSWTGLSMKLTDNKNHPGVDRDTCVSTPLFTPTHLMLLHILLEIKQYIRILSYVLFLYECCIN